MRAAFLALLALGLLGATPAAGLTPRLVKDINTVPSPQGSFPQGFATAGGLAFFTADDGDGGAELWRTDGTIAGTFQVIDACPGQCSGRPVVVAATERSVFFQAFPREGFGAVDLWVTDGSPGGTVRLGGPFLLPASGRRSLWLAGQGVLYFAANDLVDGAELWRSDGTPAGTFQVADLQPGFAGSEPAELTELAGRLVFRADDGERGPALWTSDGTAEGTRLVHDPLPGTAEHLGPDLLRSVGGKLFFAAPTTRRRAGLWTSDGTARGTAPVIDFAAAPESPAVLDLTTLGDRVLFVALEPGKGQELWTSNGRLGGTMPLTRFPVREPFRPLGDANSRLLPRTPVGNFMIFRADDGRHGIEPWVTDGTRAGTRLLADLCPGLCSGAGATDDAGIARLAAGDRLLFAGDDGVLGLELWATDGTAAGTRLVRDLCRGSCGSAPRVPKVGDGEVFLLANNAAGAPQLWRSDGTSPGTVRLTGSPSFSALAGPLTGIPLGDTFFFSAGDAARGRELWASNGTVQTTGPFADLNPEDFGGSFPSELRGGAGKAWFFADDGVNGFELWASDGTEGGTVPVHEFFPGEIPSGRAPNVEGAVESGGSLFFVVHLLEQNFSLWRSEGTPGSTVRLSPPELQIVVSEPLRAIGGQVFFVGVDAAGGEELWASDGTPEGTRRVADVVPGSAGSGPRSLTVLGDRIFFTAQVETSGRELWGSDGTAAGTATVKDIDPRPGRGSEPDLLTAHGGRLYFPADDAEHGRELWTSDGTEEGTRIAVEITPGPDGVFMTHLVSTGEHLFFSGGPSSRVLQGLWVSDGTPAGTRQLSQKLLHIDVRPIGAPGAFEGDLYFASDGDEVLWRSDGTEEGTGPLMNSDGLEIDEPEAFQAFAGHMYFSTGQNAVLYQSDGTEAGTFIVKELAAPFESAEEAASFELVVVGERLLFRAWDRFTGSELWSLEE